MGGRQQNVKRCMTDAVVLLYKRFSSSSCVILCLVSSVTTFVHLCVLEQAGHHDTGISAYHLGRATCSHFSMALWSTGGPSPLPTMIFTPVLGTSPTTTNNQPGPGGYLPPSGGPVILSVYPSSSSFATRYTRRELACTACVTNPKSIT